MKTRNACAAFFGIGFFLLFCNLLIRMPAYHPGPVIISVQAGSALWKDRTFEVILQGFILLSGVLSILLLLVFKKQEGGSL